MSDYLNLIRSFPQCTPSVNPMSYTARGFTMPNGTRVRIEITDSQCGFDSGAYVHANLPEGDETTSDLYKLVEAFAVLEDGTQIKLLPSPGEAQNNSREVTFMGNIPAPKKRPGQGIVTALVRPVEAQNQPQDQGDDLDTLVINRQRNQTTSNKSQLPTRDADDRPRGTQALAAKQPVITSI